MLNYHYILDENHKPIPCPDVIAWSEWLKADAHRIVKQEDIGGYFVSTVFLGIDHNHMRMLSQDASLPAILFETMTFVRFAPPQLSALDIQERYSTWDEAIAGHDSVSGRIRAAVVG